MCGLALVLLALGFALGAWLGRREHSGPGHSGRQRRPAALGVLGALAALGLHAAMSPAVELAWFPEGGLYHLVRGWWVLPFAMLPLGAGTAVMSTPFARKGVAVFALLVLVSAARPIVLTAAFDPRTVTGTVGPSGICYQTTDYTCGAAAAAMLLHAHGVEASEAEMATICGTNALTGTDVYSVAIGLRQQLRGSGREVRVVPADWESLLRRREPALATIRYGVLVDHWVMIRETQPAGAVVLDPVGGLRTLSREDLLAIWRGWLVTADLPTPDLPVTTGAPAPAGTASLGSR